MHDLLVVELFDVEEYRDLEISLFMAPAGCNPVEI